jgi:anaerobic ribonucleoside-triphosphate reductase activating protein
MYYGTIKKIDIADGPGVRVCLYVSGCRNHCKGCHNSETWNFNFGKEFTDDTIKKILEALKPDYIEGLTICGGEPFEPENQIEIWKLIKVVRETYPNKTIWAYTGYGWKDLILGGQKFCIENKVAITNAILRNIDVLVVGPFILEQRDITDNNRWRGSLNQRVIDVKETLKTSAFLQDCRIVYLKDVPNNN